MESFQSSQRGSRPDWCKIGRYNFWVFRKFEGRIRENREEVARETKEKQALFKAVDILENKQPEQAQRWKREPPPWLQEKKLKKPKEKERDYGMDL